MTGGTVLVLGPVGANFAAGMTGGVAFVYGAGNVVERNVNADAVASALEDDDEQRILQLLIEHRDATGSRRASDLLDRWSAALPLFWRVVPGSLHTAARPIAVPARMRA
jgi:glutamate synthase (NADPH/NADH) large chain